MAGEDNGYRQRVRALACRAAIMMGDPSRCHGAIEAHHAGNDRGVGQKAHDHTCIPLCMQHHRDWHAAAGPFRNMVKAQRREWSDAQIADTQAALGVR